MGENHILSLDEDGLYDFVPKNLDELVVYAVSLRRLEGVNRPSDYDIQCAVLGLDADDIEALETGPNESKSDIIDRMLRKKGYPTDAGKLRERVSREIGYDMSWD